MVDSKCDHVRGRPYVVEFTVDLCRAVVCCKINGMKIAFF